MNTQIDNKIENEFKIKKFFMALYKIGLQEGNNLKNDERFCLTRISKKHKDDEEINVTSNDFFSNIDDFIKNALSKKSLYYDTYFCLATTDGKGRATQNLKTRYFLGFDFDKKDLGKNCNTNFIIKKFKEVGLFYHAIVDSGNGLHYYVCIEPTNNIQLVQEVNKELAVILGADVNATLTTQILRVPGTKNIKDKNNPKRVSLVHVENSKTIKRKSIETIARNLKINKLEKRETLKKFEHVNNTNIAKCVIDIINNGSQEGHRNSDLKKIVVSLRNKNKNLEEIFNLCENWNKNNIKEYSNLKYQVEYMYNNLKVADFECGECEYKNKCWNEAILDFEYDEKDEIINIPENQIKYLKKSNRKGVKTMYGNDLLVYSMLKNHSDGLYREEIEKVITYKNRRKKVETVALSKNTLTNALKSLEENGFVTVEKVGKKKLYKLNEVRTKPELTFNISLSAAYEVVKGNISTEELRLYNYMRYIHHKKKREDNEALKGNLLQVNQVDLAKDLGVTRERVTQMIGNLLDEKILDIWYRQKSENNGFEYNVYRLNY